MCTSSVTNSQPMVIVFNVEKKRSNIGCTNELRLHLRRERDRDGDRQTDKQRKTERKEAQRQANIRGRFFNNFPDQMYISKAQNHSFDQIFKNTHAYISMFQNHESENCFFFR